MLLFVITIFGCLQFNKTLDFKRTRDDDKELDIKIQRRHLWFHTVKLYECYDTSQIISSFKLNVTNSELSDEAYSILLKIYGGALNERVATS